ncbi:MAG TPA: FHA domain-containing protein [Solirubrobacteraceae bacterium]|nr:FHA domain-containing protein [Solirubrobacteraceae bacterium]
MASIRVLTGPRAGTEQPLEAELVLGRAGTDLDIDDPEISRRHLRLSVSGGEVRVEDLGSSNGTWIGERRLREVATVGETTTIALGGTRIEIVIAPIDTATRLRDTPAASPAKAPAPAAPAPDPTSLAAPPPGGPLAPFGAYTAERRRRPRRGPASRLLFPATVTGATIVGTAVALIIYFASRAGG